MLLREKQPVILPRCRSVLSAYLPNRFSRLKVDKKIALEIFFHRIAGVRDSVTLRILHRTEATPHSREGGPKPRMGKGGSAMSSNENEFERLMERVRLGDPEAGRELFERYGKAIQMVVRYRMDRRLRSQFDSLDFAQDVWASFFRIPAGDYAFQTPEELMAFLTRVVQFKMIDAYRKRCRHSQKSGREFHRSQSNVDEQPARQPTPSHVASIKEEWLRLLENKPPKIQRALEMLRDGYSRREIAERLGLHPKRIQRLIKRLNYRRSL